MIKRCTSPANAYYSDYGGRGIKVCERWLWSYEAFILDVGRKPTAKHSLDRINNNGNYEPGNVRWATTSEQLRNRRTTRLNAVGVVLLREMYKRRNRMPYGGGRIGNIAHAFGVTERYVAGIGRGEHSTNVVAELQRLA